jgi:protein-disulfide isomerase
MKIRLERDFPSRPAARRPITAALMAAVAFGAAGCASRSPAQSTAPSPPPPAAAAPVATPVPVVPLTPQELVALERVPGKTPALSHEVEPAPAAVAGLPGTPGPSPAYGREDAPVRVYVFTDFQCPVCPRVAEPMKYLVRAHPDDVRVILKMNALPSHGRAARLAAAGLAAFRQGKFWEFHDRLFANPQRNSDEDLVSLAQAIGLDVSRFRADMDDEAVTEQVKYESALAVSLDLASTPGLVVNGVKSLGWGSYMSLENRVKQEIARAQRIAKEGAPAARLSYEATRKAEPDGEKLAAALYAATK